MLLAAALILSSSQTEPTYLLRRKFIKPVYHEYSFQMSVDYSGLPGEAKAAVPNFNVSMRMSGTERPIAGNKARVEYRILGYSAQVPMFKGKNNPIKQKFMAVVDEFGGLQVQKGLAGQFPGLQSFVLLPKMPVKIGDSWSLGDVSGGMLSAMSRPVGNADTSGADLSNLFKGSHMLVGIQNHQYQIHTDMYADLAPMLEGIFSALDKDGDKGKKDAKPKIVARMMGGGETFLDESDCSIVEFSAKLDNHIAFPAVGSAPATNMNMSLRMVMKRVK